MPLVYDREVNDLSMKVVKSKVQEESNSTKQLYEDYYIVEKIFRLKYVVSIVIFVAAGYFSHL